MAEPVAAGALPQRRRLPLVGPVAAGVVLAAWGVVCLLALGAPQAGFGVVLARVVAVPGWAAPLLGAYWLGAGMMLALGRAWAVALLLPPLFATTLVTPFSFVVTPLLIGYLLGRRREVRQWLGWALGGLVALGLGYLGAGNWVPALEAAWFLVGFVVRSLGQVVSGAVWRVWQAAGAALGGPFWPAVVGVLYALFVLLLVGLALGLVVRGLLMLLAPGQQRSAAWQGTSSLLESLAPAFALLGIWVSWEFGVQAELTGVSRRVLPPPSGVHEALLKEIGRPPQLVYEQIASQLGPTLYEAAWGFLLGTALSVLFAALFVYVRAYERTLYPIAILLSTVPVVAILPILFILFSRSHPKWPQIIVSILISFFPTLVNMTRGLKTVDPLVFELLTSLNASGWQVFWKLRLPSSLPYLFSSFKISATGSVIGAIVGEWLGASSGLGFLAVRYQSQFRAAELYGVILTTALSATLIFALIGLAERLALPWHRER
ncbi:MAG: ABC transporter permease [Deinococcus sp.]|nr:ABC transporter permease [Deinococcus sp.]